MSVTFFVFWFVLGTPSFADICNRIVGQVRSVGPVEAIILTSAGERIKVDVRRISDSERNGLMSSVGTKVDVCFPQQVLIKN